MQDDSMMMANVASDFERDESLRSAVVREQLVSGR
jgi:hypothetical protein